MAAVELDLSDNTMAALDRIAPLDLTQAGRGSSTSEAMLFADDRPGMIRRANRCGRWREGEESRPHAVGTTRPNGTRMDETGTAILEIRPWSQPLPPSQALRHSFPNYSGII